MKLIRKKVCPDILTEFKFDVKSYDFLVKNLTDGDILVSFNEFDENKNIKIPAFMSQVITMNVNHKISEYLTDTLTIKTAIEGEVEVQCLMH